MSGESVNYDERLARSGLSRQLGRAMCAAWGLDPKHVSHIEIHWTPDELPHAVVHLMLTEGAVRELLTLCVVERRPAP